jgi:tagatose-1,6-bisphosphate aldolase
LSRRPTFRQSDVTRAFKAAQKAGVDVDRVEVDPISGKVIIYVRGEEDEAATMSQLDKWIAADARPS